MILEGAVLGAIAGYLVQADKPKNQQHPALYVIAGLTAGSMAGAVVRVALLRWTGTQGGLLDRSSEIKKGGT